MKLYEVIIKEFSDDDNIKNLGKLFNGNPIDNTTRCNFITVHDFKKINSNTIDNIADINTLESNTNVESIGNSSDYISIYIAYYYNIKLAISDSKKVLKEFLNRKMFTKIQDKITIEAMDVESKIMLNDSVEKLILSNIYGIAITGFEYKIIKEDYFNYLDSMCNTIDNLKKLMILCEDKQSVNNTINQINDLLTDPYDKMPEWIQSHSIVNSPNIFTYTKELNQYKVAMGKCNITL